MRKDWEIKKFAECFKLKSGEGLTSKMMNAKGVYPVFGGNGIAGYHDKYNLKGDNVIIGRVGALCGIVRNIKENIWLTDNAFRIVDFNYEFDPSFLTYLLNLKNLRDYARQTAQPVISNSSLKDLVLEFPKSLSEQKRIVAILDETFAAIDKAKANAEKNLQNAKELFESYLQNMFENKGEDWEEKSLIEVCLEITDGSHFSPKSSGQDEYPYITVRDINEDIIDFKNCKFINKYSYQLLLKNGCKPNIGDLLFSKDGTVGKVSLVDFEKDFVVLSSLAIIRPKSKVIISSLLKYILKNPAFLQTAIGMKTGVAIRRIILANLKLIKISFPRSLSEQKLISEKLNALSSETKKLEAIYQKKIEDLEELKKSVLQKAFNGDLTDTTKLYATEQSTLPVAAEPEKIYNRYS